MRDHHQFFIGDILRLTSHGINFRLLHILPGEESLVVIRMPDSDSAANAATDNGSDVSVNEKGRPPLPVLWSIPGVLEQLDPEKNELEIIRDTTPPPPLGNLSQAQLMFRKRTESVIAALGDCEPEIYFPETRMQLVRKSEIALGLTRQTIFNYLRLYWYAGKDLGKVVAKFNQCGAPGRPRQSDHKLGRKRSMRLQEKWGIGVNVNQQGRENIRQTIKTAWAQGKSLPYCYKFMLNRYYWQDLVTPEGVVDFNPSRLMTYDQFRYHAEQLITEEEKLRARLSPHVFQMRTRAKYKGSRSVDFEVGRVFQIDGIKVNIPLVMTEDRNKYPGTLGAIIVCEVVTGMVVGFSVGWEAEIYESVMMALINTVTDKVDLCRRFGVDIEPWEWSAQHFCQSLVGDRGSAYYQVISDGITRATGPNPLANAPPYMADLKGVIESINGAVKSYLAQYVTGAYKGKGIKAERGSPDVRLGAFMILAEARRAFIRAILKHNLSIKKHFPTFPELVADGVPTCPQLVWNWSLKNHRHRLSMHTPEQMELRLLPRETAQISTQGIYLGDELFYAPEEGRPTWYRQMELKAKPLEVVVNRQCVDYIYFVHPEEPGKYVRCELLQKSLQFKGMTRKMVEETRKERSLIDRLYQPQQISTELKRMAEQQQDEMWAAQSKGLTQDPNQSKANMLGNVAENRAKEKHLERKKLSAHMAKLGQGVPGVVQPQAAGASDGFAYPDFDEDI